MDVEFLLILCGLFFVAVLYSSVGHGGASGYLAVLSLTSYGVLESGWLKQHAWCLNLIVASIAFYHYYRAGYHVPKLSLPFIAASVPFALMGGYVEVGGVIYDTLLSITLIWAAWRLFGVKEYEIGVGGGLPNPKVALPVGASIGLISGVVGVGGGIFLSPILLLKKWATPKTAAATAALFIWVNSLAGLCGAAASGQLVLEMDTLLPFVGVVLVGGIIGSHYGATIAPQQIIRKMLVLVLIIGAMRRVLGMFGLWA